MADSVGVSVQTVNTSFSSFGNIAEIGKTQQNAADSVGVSRDQVQPSFVEFGNIANLHKTQQNAADSVGVKRQTANDSFAEFGNIASLGKTQQNGVLSVLATLPNLIKPSKTRLITPSKPDRYKPILMRCCGIMACVARLTKDIVIRGLLQQTTPT